MRKEMMTQLRDERLSLKVGRGRNGVEKDVIEKKKNN